MNLKQKKVSSTGVIQCYMQNKRGKDNVRDFFEILSNCTETCILHNSIIERPFESEKSDNFNY